jgi:anti-anti-sigma factor
MNEFKDHDRPTPGPAKSLGDARCAMRGNVLIARMSGEIDLSNAEKIGDKVAQAIPDHALDVVLDLTNVGYLDSAGIYVIHGLRQRLEDRGQSLMLVLPKPGQVRRTLEIVQVTRQIPIAPTVADALRTLGQTGS